MSGITSTESMHFCIPVINLTKTKFRNSQKEKVLLLICIDSWSVSEFVVTHLSVHLTIWRGQLQYHESRFQRFTKQLCPTISQDKAQHSGCSLKAPRHIKTWLCPPLCSPLAGLAEWTDTGLSIFASSVERQGLSSGLRQGCRGDFNGHPRFGKQLWESH